MKRISNYLKMRVLGALEHAPGDTMHARYRAVGEMTFLDEDGQPRQFTWRTIQTWWYYYRKHGITEAPVRSDSGTLRKLTPEDILAAIEKALPTFHTSSRSGKRARPLNIQALYRACIEQGHLRRDQIAPNTFRRAVNKYDLLKDEQPDQPKRRLAFAKAHANDLWQVDSLHGPYLRYFNQPNPAQRPAARQVYLIAFIDDASRVITNARFYHADNSENLIDCFQSALYKRGVPKAIYADNGSNYSSKEFAQICARLGTILIHTPVRDGAAKGKIERFFRTVRDQFLSRNLDSISSLEELNDHLTRWVEDTYHTREHSTLGMKPIDRFGLDLSRIRFLRNSEFNNELFYLEATRKVRIDNTFSFQNIRYEAPRDLRQQTILIRYSRFPEDKGKTPPIVFQQDQRLGAATPLDRIANDRRPETNI